MSDLIPLRIGQIWQEVDKRAPDLPRRKIVGFYPDGFVKLARSDGTTGRCNPMRFNGKPTGYRLILEASND